MVKYSFRGAWAGIIVAAVLSALLITALFFSGMILNRPVNFFGMNMEVADGGAFQFELDIRPILVASAVGLGLGAVIGAIYGRRRARRS
jgi:ABC-type antimicrobial peptide transport system permease subunit